MLCHGPSVVGHHPPCAVRKFVAHHVRMQHLGHRCLFAICPAFSSWGLLCHHLYVGHSLPYAAWKAVACHVRIQLQGYRCSPAICPLFLWGLLCCCSHVGHRPPGAMRKVVAPCVCMLWAVCSLAICPLRQHMQSLPEHSVGCARAGSDYLSLLGG